MIKKLEQDQKFFTGLAGDIWTLVEDKGFEETEKMMGLKKQFSKEEEI